MPDLAAQARIAGQGAQIGGQEFRDGAGIGIEEMAQRQGPDLRRPVQPVPRAGHLEGLKRGLVKMHMRVLGRRRAGAGVILMQQARRRIGQMCLQRLPAGLDLGQRRGVSRCASGQRKDHEALVIAARDLVLRIAGRAAIAGHGAAVKARRLAQMRQEIPRRKRRRMMRGITRQPRQMGKGEQQPRLCQYRLGRSGVRLARMVQGVEETAVAMVARPRQPAGQEVAPEPVRACRGGPGAASRQGHQSSTSAPSKKSGMARTISGRSSRMPRRCRRIPVSAACGSRARMASTTAACCAISRSRANCRALI